MSLRGRTRNLEMVMQLEVRVEKEATAFKVRVGRVPPFFCGDGCTLPAADRKATAWPTPTNQ